MDTVGYGTEEMAGKWGLKGGGGAYHDHHLSVS